MIASGLRLEIAVSVSIGISVGDRGYLWSVTYSEHIVAVAVAPTVAVAVACAVAVAVIHAVAVAVVPAVAVAVAPTVAVAVADGEHEEAKNVNSQSDSTDHQQEVDFRHDVVRDCSIVWYAL